MAWQESQYLYDPHFIRISNSFWLVADRRLLNMCIPGVQFYIKSPPLNLWRHIKIPKFQTANQPTSFSSSVFKNIFIYVLLFCNRDYAQSQSPSQTASQQLRKQESACVSNKHDHPPRWNCESATRPEKCNRTKNRPSKRRRRNSITKPILLKRTFFFELKPVLSGQLEEGKMYRDICSYTHEICIDPAHLHTLLKNNMQQRRPHSDPIAVVQ